MTELELLQSYWWLLIAILGAALVFLLFVQGGQSMLYCDNSHETRQLMVNSLGRKWEFTFTTLVTFGGAFFASFPLFYSTSFGGAYWLWLLILFSFILQAVSYEFRRKSGNLLGTRTYDTFLIINGVAGCVLLGVAVGMFFFGGEFTIGKGNILDASTPVISRWAPTHGLEAIADWRCLLLGVAVFFLARTLAAMYFINDIAGEEAFTTGMRRRTLINGLIFAVLFVAFLSVLFTTTGYRSTDIGFKAVDYIYFHNIIDMWWLAILLILAVVAVLIGIGLTAFTTTCAGIWWSGLGTAAAVIVLFCLAGYNGTAYLASTLDPDSSLTIANSSSSPFTLRVMSFASILIPFVLTYIVCVWRKMNARPLTSGDLDRESHKY